MPRSGISSITRLMPETLRCRPGESGVNPPPARESGTRGPDTTAGAQVAAAVAAADSTVAPAAGAGGGRRGRRRVGVRHTDADTERARPQRSGEGESGQQLLDTHGANLQSSVLRGR